VSYYAMKSVQPFSFADRTKDSKEKEIKGREGKGKDGNVKKSKG